MCLLEINLTQRFVTGMFLIIFPLHVSSIIFLLFSSCLTSVVHLSPVYLCPPITGYIPAWRMEVQMNFNVESSYTGSELSKTPCRLVS